MVKLIKARAVWELNELHSKKINAILKSKLSMDLMGEVIIFIAPALISLISLVFFSYQLSMKALSIAL